MKIVRLAVIFLLLCAPLMAAAPGSLVAATPGRTRIAITAKTVDSFPVLYVEHYGTYSRLDKLLQDVAKFARENGVSGRLIAVYHDNPRRTATSAMRCDVGMVLDEAEIAKLVHAFRTDLEGKKEDIDRELVDEDGLDLKDPYKLRRLAPRLVAASSVRAEFPDIPKYYPFMRDWIWENNYYLIGPVVELYDSAPEANKPVGAEIQLAIERTGVPDRR
jgi:effector-binding domain-containing protein